MDLREEILGIDDIVIKPLPVPEWKRTIFIRTIEGGVRDEFEAITQTNPRDFRARMAVACVCDEQGKLLFTNADIPALTKKSGRALDRIFAAGIKLNAITKDDVDELRKNF